MAWYMIVAWLAEAVGYFIIPIVYSLNALKTKKSDQIQRWLVHWIIFAVLYQVKTIFNILPDFLVFFVRLALVTGLLLIETILDKELSDIISALFGLVDAYKEQARWLVGMGLEKVNKVFTSFGTR